MERWNPEVPVLAQGLPPLTPKQIADADRDCVYIFNVSTRSHRQFINNRIYVIPARAEGADVSDALKIPGTVFGEEFKRTIGICTNEFARTQEDGTQVAKKIMGIAAFCAPDQDLTRWGCFVSNSPNPSKKLIEEATVQWLSRCDELVKEADGLFSINSGMVALKDGRMVSNIAQQHRDAAQELNVAQSKPWASKTLKMGNCESCGIACLPNIAFCPNGCIVNEEKARKSKPWLFNKSAA